MQSPKEEEDRTSIGVEKTPVDDAASRYAALRNHSIRFEDAIDPNAERVDKLGKMDVVFGRGKGYQNHPGNQRMRSIIDGYKIKYHTLKRAEKKNLVEQVYNEIVEGGVRFLKKDNNENSWILVDAPVAMQKVSHTLRCRKLKGADTAELANDTNLSLAAQRSNVAIHPQADQSSLLMMQRGEILPSMQAANPSLASFYGSLSGQPSAGSFGGSLGRFGMGTGSSFAGLQGQQLSSWGGYGGIGNLPMMGAPAAMDYYTLLRRQQLVQEATMRMQQQQDAAMSNSARLQLATNNEIESLAMQQYVAQFSMNNRGGDNNAPPTDGSTRYTTDRR
ncbi:unnamed protein product [Cylindrotheca closterium]|uniref:DUF6824 domain-containing protein n=1 Tax=Cylindrotheca closterium TaxID=2856 RepID=A0AAD2FL95_9STRA|nr:unnamed protein product [Cylindrotheca closterium]